MIIQIIIIITIMLMIEQPHNNIHPKKQSDACHQMQNPSVEMAQSFKSKNRSAQTTLEDHEPLHGIIIKS